MHSAIDGLFYEPITKGRTLIIADENFTGTMMHGVSTDMALITNRMDVFTVAQQQQIEAVLSDFDFSGQEDHRIDTILLRLPKSKTLTHYLLNEAKRLLAFNGHLIITGYNDEGIKNNIQKAAALLGAVVKQKLLGKGLRYAKIERLPITDIERLPKSDYHAMEQIPWPFGLLYSKPGIYGGCKIDQGSQLLIDTVLAHVPKIAGPLLDLGCGYGLLAVRLGLHYQPEQLIATDNNVTAVALCRRNFKENGLVGTVVADDCGQTLADHSVACIICNPPFHQGFATSKALTLKFVAAIKRLLMLKGEAWLVVNRFIEIESLIGMHHMHVEIIVEQSGFKVLKIWPKK